MQSRGKSPFSRPHGIGTFVSARTIRVRDVRCRCFYTLVQKHGAEERVFSRVQLQSRLTLTRCTANSNVRCNGQLDWAGLGIGTQQTWPATSTLRLSVFHCRDVQLYCSTYSRPLTSMLYGSVEAPRDLYLMTCIGWKKTSVYNKTIK